MMEVKGTQPSQFHVARKEYWQLHDLARELVEFVRARTNYACEIHDHNERHTTHQLIDSCSSAGTKQPQQTHQQLRQSVLQVHVECTSFFVSADSGAWVEQRSCLQHAGAGSLMNCARAIRTSFPGCQPDQWSYGTPGAEDHVEFGDDAEFESEIEVIVGVLEPMTRLKFSRPGKQTRTAMTKKRSSTEG